MLSKAAKPSEGWSEQPQTVRFFRPPLAPPNLGGETDTQSAEKAIKKKLLTPKMRKVMKKEKWKTVIQVIVSILTAALTALGTTSCMGHGPIWL